MSQVNALGKITVTTAGTPVRVTSTQATPSASIKCHTVFIQALKDNTGRIYIGRSTLVKSTYVGVIAVLPAPSAAAATGTLPFFDATAVPSPNGFNLADFYLDSEVNGEGVIVSYIEV